MDIEDYRTMIDSIDREIVEGIARRTDIARKIGDEKEKQDLPVRDPDREQAIRNHIHDLFVEHELPEEYADDVAEILFAISKEAQR